MNNLANIGDDLTGLIDDIRRIDNNDDLRVVWTAMKLQWERNTAKKVQTINELDLVDAQFKNGSYRSRVTKVNKKTVGITILEGPWIGRKLNHNISWITKVTQEMIDAQRAEQTI